MGRNASVVGRIFYLHGDTHIVALGVQPPERRLAVIVSGGSTRTGLSPPGYNGFLAGAPHSSCVRDGHEIATVHAEQNAISDAARRGVSVNGATAYITHFPCVNCAKILISAGIKSVRYLHDYHNDDIVYRLFEESGISVSKL